MGAWMKKAEQLYRKVRPIPYEQEMLKRLQPMYTLMGKNYFNYEDAYAYIVYTQEDVVELTLNLSGEYNTHIVSINAGDAVTRAQKMYGEDYKGVFYYFYGDSNRGALLLNENTQQLAKMKRVCRVREVPDVLESEMYKAYKTMGKLLGVLSSKNKDEDTVAYIRTLSRKQELVDYIIKLECIGEDEEVFYALEEKEEDYLQTFFKPLHMLTNQVANKRDNVADVKLENIIAWSSTKLLEVEKPKGVDDDYFIQIMDSLDRLRMEDS